MKFECDFSDSVFKKIKLFKKFQFHKISFLFGR